MKRVKNLNLYQKLLLTIMPAMALVFAILYSITISKVGFYYKNTILKPIQENVETYKNYFPVYQNIYKSLKPQFSAAADLNK